MVAVISTGGEMFSFPSKRARSEILREVRRMDLEYGTTEMPPAIVKTDNARRKQVAATTRTAPGGLKRQRSSR